MPVHKRKYRDGRVVWCYKFDAPGSTREKRIIVQRSGFATRKEAQEAEARARAAWRNTVAAPVPMTVGALLEEFMARHVEHKLAPKTAECYRELVGYLDRGLLALSLAEVTPLHFHREWERLSKSGGRSRTGDPRPLAPKTVRSIAGVVSAAFGRAVKWGLVDRNPVSNSEPPVAKKSQAAALTPEQQRLVIESASGPWCIRAFLELAAATGCRRGELLALRWSDIVDGCAIIARSLTQTKDKLEFKTTKTGMARVVPLPPSAMAVLAEHRRQQDEFRKHYGPDYRADLDLVFCNRDGSPLKPDSVSAAVSAVFRRLKIAKPKGAALHLFRHSHTSILIAAGVPLPAVAARLGHASVRTTQEIYAHMIAGQDREAARKWEEYFAPLRAAPGKEEMVQ